MPARARSAEAVRAAYRVGRLPLDVVEQARRRLDDRAQPVLLEAIIAEHSRYSAAAVEPRWQAQVDDPPSPAVCIQTGRSVEAG
jgi:hypothetical protein